MLRAEILSLRRKNFQIAMREKDHSPRKMLPSPKQGAIYPNGLPFPPLQLPFDLITAINRSTSSSASSSNDSSPSPISHHHHQHHSSSGGGGSNNSKRRHENQTDQPLDLRVEHKKSSIAFNEHEHEEENENENHLEDENSNSIIANNNYVKSDSNHEKSPSPVDDEVDLNGSSNSGNNNNSRNIKRMLNNHQHQHHHQLNMNGLSAATQSRLSNASLFPPPSLHPLMLEAITKAARLGIPYNAAFPLLPPPPSQVAFDIATRRLNKDQQDLLNVPQLLNHHTNNSHCKLFN